MKFTRVAAAVAAAVVVSACSSNNNERASGDFDYVQDSQPSALQVPADLEQPQNKSGYKVPNADVDGPVGEQVNVTAPDLIRPIALGSRVLENEQQSTVYFDVVEGMDQPIVESVWLAAERVLQRHQLQWQQSGANTWVTETVSRTDQLEIEDANFWSFEGDANKTLEREFRYQLTQQPAEHGRTTALTVELVDAQQTLEGRQRSVPALTQSNLEVELVNKVISELNRLHQEKVQERSGTEVPLRIATNTSQQPAFIVGKSFENAWPLTGQALEQIGLIIDDLNRDAGTYFVEYSEPDSGFLFIGGDDYEPLAIAEGEYEVRLVEFDDDTSVTILQEGEPLSAETLASLQQAFQQALQQQNQR